MAFQIESCANGSDYKVSICPLPLPCPFLNNGRCGNPEALRALDGGKIIMPVCRYIQPNVHIILTIPKN